MAHTFRDDNLATFRSLIRLTSSDINSNIAALKTFLRN